MAKSKGTLGRCPCEVHRQRVRHGGDVPLKIRSSSRPLQSLGSSYLSSLRVSVMKLGQRFAAKGDVTFHDMGLPAIA